MNTRQKTIIGSENIWREGVENSSYPKIGAMHFSKDCIFVQRTGRVFKARIGQSGRHKTQLSACLHISDW